MEDRFSVVEWTIENFSCWNGEIHEKFIKSPVSVYSPGLTLDLFPKGLISSQEERMVVRIGRSFWIIHGELSFVASDGSLLCTQQVDFEENQKVLELPPGPKFEEVVSKIWIKGAVHKDRFTLRLKMKSFVDCVEHLCTTIGAVDASFEISIHMLDPSVPSNTKNEIAWVTYPYDNTNTERMYLHVSDNRFDSSKIDMILKTGPLLRNILVLTSLSVLDDEKDVVRTEDNQHLFKDSSPWTFSNSLTREDVEKKAFSVVFYLKIVHYMNSVSVGLSVGSLSPITRNPSVEFRTTGTNKVPKSKILTDDALNRQSENALKGLSKELMCLYQDQDFSDFQLKCGTASFRVHRNILSARSPVFKSMFSCDMKEAESGCMDIEDLDVPTLARFLAFLYTGAVDDLQCQSVLKLYYVADKYQVPTLKKECVDYLCANVSMSNVCDVLSLADKHQDDQLTSVAHEFISGNYNEVLRSEGWKGLMKTEPMLGVTTLTHLADKNYVTITKTQ